MGDIVRSEDARVKKTCGALAGALRELMERRRFGKISILDICGAASVSRAAFYAHFRDKYDLLEYWLWRRWEEMFGQSGRPQGAETADMVCSFLGDNMKIMANLLRDPDVELTELLSGFFANILAPPVGYGGMEPARETAGEERVAVIKFCAGGLLNLALWQTRDGKIRRDAVSMRMSYVREVIRVVLEHEYATGRGANRADLSGVTAPERV